jgi:gluconolactonase
MSHLRPTIFAAALALTAGWYTATAAAEQDFSASTIIAKGAKLERLADGFAFTEGPACDAAGNVYFTDQPNDRILMWSTDGRLSTFLQPCGRSNGLCFAANGQLIACADEKNEMWSIDVATRKPTVLFSTAGDKLLNGPNDVWVHPDGALYFSDPFYKRGYWKRGPSEQPVQGVYRVPKGSTTPVRVVDDLEQPNGIIGTPDGRTLYVTDIKAKRTWRYAIAADGSLGGKTLHCEMGSDGMTLDERGNLYLTNQGVTVFDPSGGKIQHIEVPESWTANICFGGADRKLLFITASKGVYGLKMQVAGAGSQ